MVREALKAAKSASNVVAVNKVNISVPLFLVPIESAFSNQPALEIHTPVDRDLGTYPPSICD